MKDYLTDDSNDLIWEDGDLKVGESTAQHQRDLLILDKGSLEEFPTSCVGLANYLETDDIAGLIREAKSEFVKDGMTVDVLKFDNTGKLITQAAYK